MAITPGDDIETKTSEPLPRGSWFDRAGKITREVMNYFNGKDRLAGEIVSGINRNRQNIVQLETDYQAADGALSTAYIAADAVVAADAESARAELSTTLTAAYQAADEDLSDAYIAADAVVAANAASANASLQTTLEAQITSGDTTTLASAQSYTDTEVTAEGVARATADDTVLATTRSESQRPNLIPFEYRMFGEREVYTDETVVVVLQGGVTASSGNANPYTLEDSARFTGNGSQSYIRVRLTPSSGATNMVLPPAKYAYKIAFRVNDLDFTTLTVRLRDASNSIVKASTPDKYYAVASGSETTWVEDIEIWAEGVLDYTASTDSAVYLEIEATGSTTLGSNRSFFLYRTQLEQIPASSNAPGDWTGEDGLTATARILRDAFVGSDGQAIAKIVLEAAAGGGNPARIGLRDSANGSSIALVAEQIFFGDDTVFEDTYNSIYTESGGYRLRILGPFPSSGDLVIWYGSTSVALNSETKTNGVFALATDGKVYFGSADLSTEVGNLKATAIGGSWFGTAGAGRQTNNMTCSVSNGSGSQTYRWSSDDPAVSFTSPTSATTKAQRDISVGVAVEATCRCLVTDGTESAEAVALASWDPT